MREVPDVRAYAAALAGALDLGVASLEGGRVLTLRAHLNIK